jgi:hypothetical protein
MGYETRLFVGRVHEQIPGKGNAKYFEVMAVLEIGKWVFDNSYIDEEDKSIKCFLVYDSDEECYKDKYNSDLYALAADKVLAILKNERKSDIPECSAAASYLETILKHYNKTTVKIKCLLFGH